MQVTVRDADSVKVVMIDGKLDTNTAPQAEAEVRELLDAGAAKLLVNFENLDYISSAGLRFLLVTAKRMKKEGGELRICNLNTTVQEVFDISGFGSILSVAGSEDEALQAF